MSITRPLSSLGVYIHIPFCRSKCVYCDFYSLASIEKKEELLRCIHKEITTRSAQYKNSEVSTIYIGGGTPSLLEGADVEQLLGVIRECMCVSSTAEITIEANPDDITLEKSHEWVKAGINRVSVGVQSFDDTTLRKIGRRHTGEKAQKSISILHSAGIKNTTLDIIYGIPERSDETLLDDIKTAIKTGVKHVSAYALTQEEGTIMDKMIKKGTFPPLDDDMAARQYNLVCDTLQDNRYKHYEISNFALEGYRSRHNSAYWTRIPYMGVGPSAHSFYGDKRRWNISSVGKYIKGVEENTVYWEEETLSPRDIYNEIVMTSLRCVEGVDLEEIRERFGREYVERIKSLSARYIDEGLVVLEKDRLRLTRRGVFLSDGIESDFFMTEDDKII